MKKKLYAIFYKKGLYIKSVTDSKKNAEELAQELAHQNKTKYWVEEIKITPVKK